jgi:hypothetical protein
MTIPRGTELTKSALGSLRTLFPPHSVPSALRSLRSLLFDDVTISVCFSPAQDIYTSMDEEPVDES